MLAFCSLLFLICLSGVVFFQIALAFGAPWGYLAMGGKFPGKFPPAMRIAAVFQAFLLCFLGWIVALKGNWTNNSEWQNFSSSAIWFVFGFSVIASVLNLITPSEKERNIWAPVSLIMMISSLILALN